MVPNSDSIITSSYLFLEDGFFFIHSKVLKIDFRITYVHTQIFSSHIFSKNFDIFSSFHKDQCMLHKTL